MHLLRILTPFFFVLISNVNYAQVLDKGTLQAVKKLEKVNVYDTSGEKMSYVDPEGNTWIEKSNPVNLVINEFVSSKIFELVLGSGVPVGHLLIGDSQIGFAFKSTPKFSPYGVSGKSPSGGEPLLKTLRKATAQKKNVIGLESAVYATMLVFDNDIDKGNNFAKIETEDEVIITRFDFDDSLKFFDCFDITETYLLPDMVQKLQAKGLLQYVREQLKCEYKKPSKEWIQGKLPGLNLSIAKMKATHEYVLSHKDELRSAIEQAYQDVEEQFSESQILEAYNFSRLHKIAKNHKIDLDSSAPAAQQLAAFTISVINRRLLDLDKIYGISKIDL